MTEKYHVPGCRTEQWGGRWSTRTTVKAKPLMTQSAYATRYRSAALFGGRRRRIRRAARNGGGGAAISIATAPRCAPPSSQTPQTCIVLLEALIHIIGSGRPLANCAVPSLPLEAPYHRFLRLQFLRLRVWCSSPCEACHEARDVA